MIPSKTTSAGISFFLLLRNFLDKDAFIQQSPNKHTLILNSVLKLGREVDRQR